MPIIPVERVLSVNSEDPAYPAENLLKSDNNKRWKCKAGEKQAIVILQLKRNTVIEAIDIGNEHSAFVEVLVGRSSSPNEDYKVLLVTSSLMTLREAKDGTNINGVRFFKKADLTKPTCEEKWDRVKIVCSQPFNKHVQYGLSFVTLHAPGDSGGSGEASSSLGRFALKEDKEEPPVTVGSWFAKRKDPPPPVPPGAAAAIRDASSPAAVAKAMNKKPTPKRPKANTPKNGALKPDKAESKNPTPKRDLKALQQLKMSLGDDEDSPADDTDADSTYSPNKDSASVLSDDDVIPEDSDEERPQKRPKRNKKDSFKRTIDVAKFNGQTSKQKVNDTGGKQPKTPKETKPFNRLLDGVTIVISGYQNPLRGELRSKACAMGARYKADWDNTCTHLICAFVNTPKFNQVRGRGKIVKKEWVEECHSLRKRLPWRRFALDRNDVGTSSEEEVWEEGSVPTTSGATTTANTIASGTNRRCVSSGSDTEEEIERVRARQTQTKKTAVKPADKSPIKPSDPFDADTDVESDSESQTDNLPLPPLPQFFSNITFHIALDISDDERRKLRRYIVAYNGAVADDMDGSVEYVITQSPDVAAAIGEEFGVSCVRAEWIWECSDAATLIPIDQFSL